ncbi:hypothetical protein Q2T76_05000 [Lactobacillus sp. YT155]|uniref:hypothetical protein n=1 Tax=Lactobacillus sp. YT155 TaxID=3060955 RepID=UPI00265D8F02|nr:hypothetical protein [Lactobacillus sp. YT155]MDO1605416.1 hypothetical protein [Lactobacillus sp. YT155]
MRKVVFEQVGNIILSIILTIASCQTVLTSKFTSHDSQLNFGVMWFLLILCAIVFSTGRFFYAKKFGIKDGYTEKDGELSAQDEREKVVGLEAAKITYRLLTYFLVIVLILFALATSFIESPITLRLFIIVIIGSGLVMACLTFLISWIVFDNRKI